MKCSTRRSFAHSGRPGMHVGLLVICMILLLNLLGQVVFAQTTPIQHIVFIVKENRGFDHMFGRFPGAEGATQGMISTGQIIPLSRAPDSSPRDYCHTWNCNIAAYDGGRMDKWDVTVGPADFACNINGDYGCYSQYQQADIPNYWSLASTYTLSDHMFSSIHATSFPNHMYTVAAQSAGIIGQPHLITDSGQGESGCKSDPGSTINVLTSTGNLITPFPCFEFGTITDSLDNASGGPISWSYYSPHNSPYDPLEAINHIRNNAALWDAHVFSDQQFIPDVQSGKLAAVTWLVSSDQNNEHPPWSICQGENWTVNQITAIMNSSFWDSTAIFVVWDDNGGFYDHYPQPQVDQWGFGPRVPMLIVSPYAKPGHIAKTDYEFSSMLKFVEEVFGLSAIAERDAAANSMIGDIFDWTQQPVPPLILPPRSCSPASSTSLSFPPQQVGTPSAPKTETIYNYGPDDLNIFGINISGSEFLQTNNCPQNIPPPAPGVKSCSINVVFKPTATGTRSGVLTITDSNPGSPRTVSLTGIGTNLALTPNPLSFGQLLVSSNKLLNATLKNLGTSPVSITSIVAAGDYSQSNNCPSSLSGGAQCTITVTFAPTVAGTRYGTVTITDSDGSSPQVLNLTGIGTSISIVPATLTFPVTAVGAVSAPKQLTLTNNGNTVLTISQVAIQGTLQQDFFDFMQTNTCGGGIPPSGSCSFIVKFAPSTPGQRAGTLTLFNSETATSPLYVILTGTGAANPVPLISDPAVPASAVPGGAGFTLTVNGSNFVSGATVNWNGAALSTTFVNASKLTATVPAANIAVANTALITVTSPTPGGGTSNVVFFQVTTGGSPTGLIKSDFATGTAPTGLARGDFNGDGKLDLAIANSQSNTVSILLGAGNGTFTLKSTPATGLNPTAVAVADLNGDGKLDLAVTNQKDNTLTILLGNGDGTFTPVPASPATGAGPVTLIAADFTLEGRLDVTTANNVENFGSVLAGNGDGTFALLNEGVNMGQGPASIAVGDFNGDSFLDLAVANELDNTISILPGNGNGSFTFITSPTPGNQPGAVVAADFNGDGKLDLAVANQADSTIFIFVGLGDGTFINQSTLATATGPNSLTVGDFNGDGKLDLASANSTANSISILLGNGDGTFQSHLDSPTGTTPNSIVAGDFNGDGNLDLAVTNNASNTVSILLQPGVVQGPRVSLSPASLTFATQLVNTTSPTQTVVLTNTGNATLTITNVSATGDFLKTNQCPNQVAPGGSCNVLVAFKPRNKGVRNGTLSFTDNAPGSPQTVPLTGTGTVVQLVPSSLDFGNQQVGTKSPPKTVTLTNTGSTNLSISGITTTGINSTDFKATTTCSFVTPLAPGANCTITVTFKPAAQGSRSATVNVRDNGGGSPQLIPLTGNGT